MFVFFPSGTSWLFEVKTLTVNKGFRLVGITGVTTSFFFGTASQRIANASSDMDNASSDMDNSLSMFLPLKNPGLPPALK